MTKLNNGLHALAKQVSSPNWDERPSDCQVELLVLHGISVPAGTFGGTGIEKLFTNQSDIPDLQGLQVAAHFLVGRDGSLSQFVNCNSRAWHAGVSSWAERTACNDFSIGIELEGTDTEPYSDSQYALLVDLVADLRNAYPTVRGIAGHCHIAPGRKTDPGTAFDWPRLLTAVGYDLDGRHRNSDA